MPRKRVDRAALCSSDNYRESRKLHMDFLKERHSHFKEMEVSGRISFDVPIIKDGKLTSRFKTIRVFGKEIRLTIEEYTIHCASLGI